MKNLPKMICFDMDGTIADLYSVNGWLADLRAENPRPYLEAEPMCNMEELREVLEMFRQMGTEIRIITWLSMNSTEEYKEAVRTAKLAWLEKWNFLFDNFHGVQYGATKADSIRKYLPDGETAILIDDNAKVRSSWHMGEAIDPAEVDIVSFLRGLLED